MPQDSKTEGRKAALAVVETMRNLKPEAPTVNNEAPDFTGIAEAVQALAESRPDLTEPLAAIVETLKTLKPEATDMSAVVEALAALELSVELDLSALVEAVDNQKLTVDLTKVESELARITDALKQGNSLMTQLIVAAKTAKVVSYDAEGRIIEIRGKE